jgi:thiamine biosynthesis protein ThiS
MEIVVNGERREIPEGLSVAALIEHLDMPLDRVALERNREILSRPQWKNTPVQPNDVFEIVHFVGGG